MPTMTGLSIGSSGPNIIKSSNITSTVGNPTITTSGSYRIYKFISSGSITFNKNGVCDIMFIGGGAGAGPGLSGTYFGPGGAAGNVTEFLGVPMLAQTYSITVGGGGGFQSAGSPSIISGAPSMYMSASQGYAPSGTSSVGGSNLFYSGASGVGAGASAASSATGANGPNGYITNITGSPEYFGGGGAGKGGIGGLGGGGSENISGTANTGGGGGGYNANGGGSGGSGIVIIKVEV